MEVRVVKLVRDRGTSKQITGVGRKVVLNWKFRSRFPLLHVIHRSSRSEGREATDLRIRLRYPAQSTSPNIDDRRV
jgi:hypothetical protein